MCQSQADGGARCAAHTRPGFAAALARLADLPAEPETAREAVREAATSRVRDHAATPTGEREVTAAARQAARDGDQSTAAWLTAALREGQARRAARRASRTRTVAPTRTDPETVPPAETSNAPDPAPVFTHVDRQPQDADQKFGISDHTTTIPPSLLVPYRDKDALTRPRDPVRMQALRIDVAEHGIGNPLALFHDGKRACLAEGNHRLGVALEQQLPEVPLRVIRLRSLHEVSNFARDSKPISPALRPFLRPPDPARG